MALTVGTRIGPFLIKSSLGEGGMGIVFRALDTRLQRDVALKLLPDHLADDSERLARFQREAQLLASLNHPNIAVIHGLEESKPTALVLELVEGPTLAERIAQGPIPVEEALPIAKQIADALEYAHEHGVMHRDLKPANIKLKPDGTVKVLDFGLAKALNEDTKSPVTSNSPTLSLAATQAGVILGTAAYMSPEQAKGKEADRRADIWAFGAVFYETLTGKMAFSGETVSETMAFVMTKEPDWDALPKNTPPSIRHLLRRCLVKEPRNRLQAIGDARIAIEESVGAVYDRAQSLPETSRAVIDRPYRVASVLLLIVASAFAIPAVRHFREVAPPAPPEIRVEVNTPPTDFPVSFAISPDGRRLVFSASREGKSQLWVRPLDSLAAQPLAGTEGAAYPFWSPDSASVGFFADSRLKRIDIVGGAPQVLANTPVVLGAGGSWNRDGIILFAPNINGPLFKVSASGGDPREATRLETGQTAQRFPQFLPDGRHFVYFVFGGPAPGVYAGSLDGGSSKRLTSADAGAVVSASGFLLFPRQTTLFAQAFDFQRQELSGNPFPVAEQVALDMFDPTGAVGLSAASGIVAYRTGGAALVRQLTWLDRSGKSIGTIGAPDNAGLTEAELSPDGKRVAVSRTVNGNIDVWLIDAARGVPTRFTFDAANDGISLWSPDGNHVVFQSNRKGVFDLYWKLSSGAGVDELLLESDQPKAPADWSPDGRFLLFRSVDRQTGFDLLLLPAFGDKKPFPFLKTPFDERNGQFSPDGKWIAYQSNESGRYEIYVQPFPGPGRKFQISISGGAQPRWNKNGKEIFYVSLDSKMMAAPLKPSPDGQSLETGTPVALFPVRIAGGPVSAFNKQQYAVSPDGQRFLVNLNVDEGAASPITLIYNWKPKP